MDLCLLVYDDSPNDNFGSIHKSKFEWYSGEILE